MKLPNGADAVVDIEKLRDYCLSRSHPLGRHKARVFEAALGLAAPDAFILQLALLQAASREDAVPSVTDSFGTRYSIGFELQWNQRSAYIQSAWIVRAGESNPRFLTCYVVKGGANANNQ